MAVAVACISMDSSNTADIILISLAYAPSVDEHYYQQMTVAKGTTLQQALQQAGWLSRFTALAEWCDQMAEVETPTAKGWYVGVYAQKQPLSYVLQAHDRIEVYRDLSADPMALRKHRAVRD